MSITRSTHRTTIAALACALLVAAVPAAAAQPADMHASVAQAAADARQAQDLRSADSRDSQRRQDLNHLRAHGYTAGSNAVAPLPGPPTWPVNPQPISPAPAVHVASDTGSGLDWTTIALGIAGSLLALGGIVAVTVHARRLGRARISA